MPNEKPDSFQCGPFEVARNPDVRGFVDKLNRLREAVDQCRIQPGVGYTVNRSTNGTVLSIKPGGAGAVPPEEDYPYKVTITKKENRFFFKITTPEGPFIGSGQGAAGDAAIANAGQELPFTPDGYFYLEASVADDLTLSNYTYTASTTLLPGYEITGDRQTKSRVLLATYLVNPGGSTGSFLLPYIKQGLVTVLLPADGYPVAVMIPPRSMF
jgi:hypothetical protein